MVKVLIYISTPVLIRHLWQLKTLCFPALVSNMCCSIKRGMYATLAVLLLYGRCMLFLSQKAKEKNKKKYFCCCRKKVENRNSDFFAFSNFARFFFAKSVFQKKRFRSDSNFESESLVRSSEDITNGKIVAIIIMTTNHLFWVSVTPVHSPTPSTPVYLPQN